MPGKNILMAVGVVIVIIALLAVGVVFVLPMVTSGGLSLPLAGSGDATPTPTSSSSTGISTSGTIVPIETKASSIPPTGVYVHVNYIAGFEGSYGMANAMTIVPGNSLDRVWEVENANMTVKAEFTKQDGSKHPLLVEIYKDGVLLTKGTTTVGHGSVKLSVDPMTGTAADPVISGGDASAPAVTTPAAAATTAGAPAPTTTVTTSAASVNATQTTATSTTAPATNTTAST